MGKPWRKRTNWKRKFAWLPVYTTALYLGSKQNTVWLRHYWVSEPRGLQTDIYIRKHLPPLKKSKTAPHHTEGR
jgi:hypothetical protein